MLPTHQLAKHTFLSPLLTPPSPSTLRPSPPPRPSLRRQQESVSSTNLSRVRRFQRELEAAEERADTAESSLSMIRAKHRTFVTCQSTVLPSGETVVVKETVTQQ